MNNQIVLKDASEEARRGFITGVYSWMLFALLISGVASFLTANSSVMLRFIFGNRLVFFGLVLGELALVFFLSSRIRSMDLNVASLLFVLYSIINGVTLASIFFVYTGKSIVQVFLTTALMFGCMSVYGAKTKQDLTSTGRYLMMAVMGLVVASVLNLLFKSSSLSWIISFVAVIVFTGLTAYDTQKIMNMSFYADKSDDFKKVAIIGALMLYLDFINIFIHLLRLFGKRR